MAACDDRIVYGPMEMLFDSDDWACIRFARGAYTVGVQKSVEGLSASLRAVLTVWNGGSCVLIKKRAKGYMTIEAAIIITWTFFVFMFLIYLSFYSYDKCVLFQDAYAVCFRGSTQKQEDNVVPYINAHMKEQFGRKYFATGEVRGSVDRNGNSTDVTGECQVKVPIRAAFTMSDRSGWLIRTRARAQIINPTHIIRKSRWIGNIVD